MTARVHLAAASWLKHGEVARLLAVLDADGEEARAVGGAVRDELLRLPVGEIDVATTAAPETVVRRVEAAGWKAVPTGIEHGTITVVIEGQPFEVTTLRQDVETFGRKARVVFGRDWRADAERRDFTINALSASADGTVWDYVGGLADIAARRVRFIGDPQRRITEDYLRILRFFRFHAYYGEGFPDRDGLLACIRAREGLSLLSRERVRMELLKLVLAPHAAPTLAVMAEAGSWAPCWAAWRTSRASKTPPRSKRRSCRAGFGAAARCARRLGQRGCRTAGGAAALIECRKRAAHDAGRLEAGVAGDARQAVRALLNRFGPGAFDDRALVASARSVRCARPDMA